MFHSVGFHFICRRRRNKAGHYSSRLLRCIVSCMLWINITSITVVLCWVRWINTFDFFCLNALLYFCGEKAQKKRQQIALQAQNHLNEEIFNKAAALQWLDLEAFVSISAILQKSNLWKTVVIEFAHWSLIKTYLWMILFGFGLYWIHW